MTAPTNVEALLTSFTTYFSRFSTVFSFREPCVKKHLILNTCFLFFWSFFKVEGDLEVNPVHTIADILEHALVGHEKVAVFEAGLTTAEGIKGGVKGRGLRASTLRRPSMSDVTVIPAVSRTVAEEVDQARKEVCF